MQVITVMISCDNYFDIILYEMSVYVFALTSALESSTIVVL